MSYPALAARVMARCKAYDHRVSVSEAAVQAWATSFQAHRLTEQDLFHAVDQWYAAEAATPYVANLVSLARKARRERMESDAVAQARYEALCEAKGESDGIPALSGDRAKELERFVEVFGSSAIAACFLCDKDGYLPSGRTCDHVDRRETTKRGIAKVREVIGTPPTPEERLRALIARQRAAAPPQPVPEYEDAEQQA